MARHPIQVVSLIGMPGSGKSTVGVLLAKRLGLAFVDTDLLIQEQEQATLAEIIAAKGHEALRVIEEQVLLDMDIGPSVISTGGSVVYSERIMNRLSNASSVIYLRSQLTTVEYRISLAPDRGIASPGSHTLEDVYNELHGREVVVVKQDLVHRGFFGCGALFECQAALLAALKIVVRGESPVGQGVRGGTQVGLHQ